MSSTERFISIITDSVDWLFANFEITKLPDISIDFDVGAQKNLDERIAKLDAARKNLEDGIDAIENLKIEAERSKVEIAAATLQVEQLAKDKASLSSRLEAMQTVLTADVDAFRQVAGVPNAAAVRRERLVGFVSGVAASLVAAGLLWAGTKLLQIIVGSVA